MSQAEKRRSANRSLDRQSPTMAAVEAVVSSVYCHIDHLGSDGLHGWAMDRPNPNTPVRLHVIVDGQEIGHVVCDGLRPDVAAAEIGPAQVGLSLLLPDWLLDDQPHELTLRDPLRRIVEIENDGKLERSLPFRLRYRPTLSSCVDGFRNGGLEGWVLRTNLGQTGLHGECAVRIEWNNETVGYIRADRPRRDVAAATGGPATCGFRFVPPEITRVPGTTTFRLFLMPENIELSGSPVNIRFASDEDEERLLEIVQVVDRLEREAAQLRRQIRNLLPEPVYCLDQYDEWFPRYLTDLRRRVAARRMPGRDMPLVSVVCPIYRPELQHFEAAVRSVMAQTYTNWELILVDDGSKDPALTASIQAFVAEDPRIRVAQRRRNGGISEATNTAIAAAKEIGWTDGRLRFELFTAAAPLSGDHAFEVVLKSSGESFLIPADKSILDVLIDAGKDPLHDCKRGDCGICQVNVIEGVPDHRDYILSDAEKAEGTKMQICVSRSKTPRLVIDL